MAASNPAASADLAAQVAMFAQKMDGVLDWLWSQANPTVKDDGDKRIAAKDKEPSSFKSETSLSKTHHDDNNDDATKLMAQARLQPFWVEAQIDVPSYDGSINAMVLDAWLDQLDNSFTLYGYSSEDKVALPQLKLLTGQPLAWCNAYLWFYDEDRWKRWHSLHQGRDQTMQDDTTEFWW